MQQEIDKILDLLRDQTINVTEAERLIKAVRTNYVCQEVKEKVKNALDLTAKVVLKTVDYAVVGVEKINPVIKDATSKTKDFIKSKMKVTNVKDEYNHSDS